MPERKTMNNDTSEAGIPDDQFKLKIIGLLAELTFNSDINDYRPLTRLKEDLSLDSLGLVQLVMGLNSTFNIEIKSSELIPENFETFGNLENFLLIKTKENIKL